MYDFEDKGGRRIALRPEGTAGGRARAFVQHQPARAVEGLVRRPALPLRAPAEGPLPPALAGGGRGARGRRPAGRRRGDRAARTASTARSGCATVDPGSTRWATKPIAPRTSRCCGSTSSGRAPGSATTSASASPPTRCGCSTRRIPTGRRSSSTRRRSRSTWATTPAPTSKRCSTGSTGWGSRYEIDPRLVRGLRLLHEHHVRVQQPGARRRPERHRRRWPLRQAGRADGRQADAGHRLRDRHRTGADRVRGRRSASR